MVKIIGKQVIQNNVKNIITLEREKLKINNYQYTLVTGTGIDNKQDTDLSVITM